MVQVWLYDENKGQQSPQETNKQIDVDTLSKLGVFYDKLNPDSFAEGGRYLDDPKLKWYTTEKDYNKYDILSLSRNDSKKKDKCFSTEHFHVGDEICYVVDGSGYFDFRDQADDWIRVFIEKGDLIGIPGGIYHRFNLEDSQKIKYLRLYVGDNFFVAVNRPADDHFTRKKYLKEHVAC